MAAAVDVRGSWLDALVLQAKPQSLTGPGEEYGGAPWRDARCRCRGRDVQAIDFPEPEKKPEAFRQLVHAALDPLDDLE